VSVTVAGLFQWVDKLLLLNGPNALFFLFEPVLKVSSMAEKESPQSWQCKAQFEVWCLKWTLETSN
jgi:hypothetical protein